MWCVIFITLEQIALTIKRTAATKRKYNHPLCGVTRSLHRIPIDIRYRIAVEESVFIPFQSVACTNHIEAESWSNVNSFITPEQYFTKSLLEDLFQLLSNPPAKNSTSKESSM